MQQLSWWIEIPVRNRTQILIQNTQSCKVYSIPAFCIEYGALLHCSLYGFKIKGIFEKKYKNCGVKICCCSYGEEIMLFKIFPNVKKDERRRDKEHYCCFSSVSILAVLRDGRKSHWVRHFLQLRYFVSSHSSFLKET